MFKDVAAHYHFEVKKKIQNIQNLSPSVNLKKSRLYECQIWTEVCFY